MIPRKVRALVWRLQDYSKIVLPVTLTILAGWGTFNILSHAATTASASESDLSETHIKNIFNYQSDISGDSPIYDMPKIVTLKFDNQEITDVTLSDTLQDFINEQNIALNSEDEVLPSRDFKLTEQTSGQIIRVEKSTYTVQETIAFKKVKVENDEVEEGVTNVKQKGTNGLLEKTYEKILKDGQVYKENLISQKVLTPAVDEITEVGTKPVIRTEIVDGIEITYYKKLRVWATSYDGNCLGCNGTTATGAKLKYGIIAADPKVIPWHTKMYVAGGPGYKAYGSGQMEDTGGALKRATLSGKIHIDLGFEDVSKGWWSARYTYVYLLAK